MKPTKAERKAKKRLVKDAVVAKQILDAEIELHNRIISAANAQQIPLIQIELGKLIPIVSPRIGGGVTFMPSGTHYALLYALGAFDHDYSYTVNTFYGAWRAQQIALNQWGGRVGEGSGEIPPYDQASLFTLLVRRVHPEHIDNMKALAADIPDGSDKEKTGHYLLGFTREFQTTLALMETLIPELQNVLAQGNNF